MGIKLKITDGPNLAFSVPSIKLSAGAGTGTIGGAGPAGAGLPAGGAVGDYVIKDSATDYDFIILKNKLSFITAPTVDDDDTQGYAFKSLWFHIAAEKVYQCFSAATGAAIWIDLTLGNSREGHGTITAASPATLNATSDTEHTGDFGESWTAILAGFTAARPSILFEFVVSGSGTPTITLTGATFAFATDQNLTDLGDGTYQAVFNSVDDGSNITVYVKLVS